MQPTRALWSAVVLHAVADIDGEHYRSAEYAQAVSFFLDAGAWGESRQNIADCLNLHADDLTRLGRAAIEARHLRDGVPPVTVRAAVAAQPTTAPRPVPSLTNPVPVVPRPILRRYVREQPPRNRDWWIAQFMAKQTA